MFVRELINGQVAGQPEFKLNGIEYEHRLLPNEFLVTDGVLKSFREFATKYYKENPDYDVTPAMIEDNIEWIRTRIRYEVLTAAYGPDKAHQALADLDLQLQRAMTEMPSAAELAARSWRNRNTGRHSITRPNRNSFSAVRANGVPFTGPLRKPRSLPLAVPKKTRQSNKGG